MHTLPTFFRLRLRCTTTISKPSSITSPSCYTTSHHRPHSVSSQPTRRIKTPSPPRGTGRRTPQSRPLIYACGIFVIVGSGAIIGAVLRNDHQQESAKKKQQQSSQQANEIDYQKQIDALQAKRGYLLGQKMQLERKIETARQRQREREWEKEREREKARAAAAAPAVTGNEGEVDVTAKIVPDQR